MNSVHSVPRVVAFALSLTFALTLAGVAFVATAFADPADQVRVVCGPGPDGRTFDTHQLGDDDRVRVAVVFHTGVGPVAFDTTLGKGQRLQVPLVIAGLVGSGDLTTDIPCETPAT